jgi:hypothetical protein
MHLIPSYKIGTFNWFLQLLAGQSDPKAKKCGGTLVGWGVFCWCWFCATACASNYAPNDGKYGVIHGVGC